MTIQLLVNTEANQFAANKAVSDAREKAHEDKKTIETYTTFEHLSHRLYKILINLNPKCSVTVSNGKRSFEVTSLAPPHSHKVSCFICNKQFQELHRFSVKNIEREESIDLDEMNEHLIQEHGYFDSTIEPEKVCTVLGFTKSVGSLLESDQGCFKEEKTIALADKETLDGLKVTQDKVTEALKDFTRKALRGSNPRIRSHGMNYTVLCQADEKIEKCTFCDEDLSNDKALAVQNFSRGVGFKLSALALHRIKIHHYYGNPRDKASRFDPANVVKTLGLAYQG